MLAEEIKQALARPLAGKALPSMSCEQHSCKQESLFGQPSCRCRQASDAQTDAASILVESTALSSEAMQQGFNLGTVTSVDVLNALRDQYQAERELQRIRYDHIRYLLLLQERDRDISCGRYAWK